MTTITPSISSKNDTYISEDMYAVHSTLSPVALNKLATLYAAVRQRTEQLAKPLEVEDYCIQSMTEASPVKWHIAHTTWFFEQFVLRRFTPNYKPHALAYDYLFNSYYNTVGPQHCRSSRGMLSRPTVNQVYDYRHDIDQRMAELFNQVQATQINTLNHLVTLGINHEQQHQELLVTDVKHMLSSNPLLPAYHASDNQTSPRSAGDSVRMHWLPIPQGVHEVGNDGKSGFSFDNEQPRHRVYVERCELASRLVTNREYLSFINAGGYHQPQHWLAMGWDHLQKEGWAHPLYWYRQDGDAKSNHVSAADLWMQYTLAGPAPLNLDEPVCHVSYYEADAYARWADAKLPTEQQWEAYAQCLPVQGPFQNTGCLHPQVINAETNASTPASHAIPQDMFGQLWQWTCSSYDAYPGFSPPKGALGEYNGKFMCNQYVLRGGSCATPENHYRTTYRNFFPPESRWQFAGIRLARENPNTLPPPSPLALPPSSPLAH